jgi:ATP-dependent Lon protease
LNEKNILPISQILPNKLLLIPLNGKPIFPGIFTPLMLDAKEDVEVAEAAMASDGYIGLVLSKDPNIERTDTDNLFKIGTSAKIIKKINLPDGGVNIFISTMTRFKVQKILAKKPPTAAVVHLEEIDEDTIELRALTRALISEMKQISENNPLFSEEMRLNMVNIDHPGKIADFFSSILNVDRYEQQRILEQLDVRKRMEQVLIFIKKEQELLKIQKKIQYELNEKINKSQRDYFLKEEMKAIKKELGMPVDAASSEYIRFREAVDKLAFEGEIKDQVEQELSKFQMMDPNSSEFVVTRNYLDTIITLPWRTLDTSDVDIKAAEKILNEDHYGLEDVKKRILEYISVRKLKKDTKGSIVCLVGPPGVGKTSVGKSIARALGKKFFRFSVGGMRDEAEIKGHRRTYVGAMPGKIIQGLKIVKTRNPVFMIDEIDKLGSSYQGDPSSALLEVLDPEQNFSFRDHYLDLPFDVSDVLFIVTANTLDTIPGPLLDRMEVIHLSGYIEKDKMEIAKKYIIPKSLKNNGLEKKHIKYEVSALSLIANGYAREAGMRNFEKAVNRIHRKIAFQFVHDNKASAVTITTENLSKYLGPVIFRDNEQKRITMPGMAIGLAWTSMGGDTLIIEALASAGKGSFNLTGQMGDVMKESASIAYSWVRKAAENHQVDKKFFEEQNIHLHIPAGATPKDGPSAGITMASTLLSLALGKKIRCDLAMTGELSLTGQVLPIGGLKEKMIAARRAGIKTILFPAANERDLEEIPEHVKKGIKLIGVSTMSEVVKHLF